MRPPSKWISGAFHTGLWRTSQGQVDWAPGAVEPVEVRFGVAQMPILPIPKHAVVTRHTIEFVGWVFPISHVSKGLLVWLKATFIRWIEEDGSQRNREWIQGIADAFQDALSGEI
jgi:hypothetical protein